MLDFITAFDEPFLSGILPSHSYRYGNILSIALEIGHRPFDETRKGLILSTDGYLSIVKDVLNLERLALVGDFDCDLDHLPLGGLGGVGAPLGGFGFDIVIFPFFLR